NVAIDNGVNESSSVHVYLQISGFKFYDANGDGQWEPGEVKLSGWTIQLYENINGVLTLVGSQVTDVNGNYSFTNLWAGTYYIKEVLQPGWTQTVGNEIITTSGNVVDNFGNLELGKTGLARTKGYWANKGNSSITQSWLQVLTTLNLRNADGSLFKFTYDPNGTLTSKQLSADRAQLANFLNGASA